MLVLDSRTGYDPLNGTALGEDKRLAIDIAALKQSLSEDAGGRLIRWVPGEELLANDLTKLCGNQKLMNALMTATWALRDAEVGPETSCRRSGKEEVIPAAGVGEPGLCGTDENPPLAPKGASVPSE